MHICKNETNVSEEIWKDVEGYEGLYQISNLGNVKSLDRYVKQKDNKIKHIKEKMLTSHDNNRGYLAVNLSKDGKTKTHTVHRLIATAFIPNPENKPCIDHINAIRTDNRIENLRWATYSENNSNPICLEKKSKVHKGKKLSKEHIEALHGSIQGEKHPKATICYIYSQYGELLFKGIMKLCGQWLVDNGYLNTLESGRKTIYRNINKEKPYKNLKITNYEIKE